MEVFSYIATVKKIRLKWVHTCMFCFNFNIKKTKCMMVYKDCGCFTRMPQWILKNKLIQNVEDMDILAVTVNNIISRFKYKKQSLLI